MGLKTAQSVSLLLVFDYIDRFLFTTLDVEVTFDRLQIAMSPTSTNRTSDILGKILDELRLLRQEVKLIVPQEDLDEYSDGDRVEKSYKKALKEYPPLSAWK